MTITYANIALIGALLMFGALLMTCSSSTKGNMLRNTTLPSSSPPPDPRFRSAANDPELRQARETGTYSSVLQHLVEPDALVYISRTTVGVPDIGTLDDKINSDTIQDFIEANTAQTQLRNKFDVYSDVKVVDVENPADFLEEKRRDGIAGVGLLLMSRVGLNDRGTEAVIYVEHYQPQGGIDRIFCTVLRDAVKSVSVRCFAAGFSKRK
jgi:hypothetical protein